MQIIPALYIHNGKAASYFPGDYESIDYLDLSPHDIIELLGKHDVQRILLLDIDAARQDREHNKGLIGSLANVAIPDLAVGGGIDDYEYLKMLQYAGVDFFIFGSAVFRNFDLIKQICEADDVPIDRIMISLDMRDGRLTTLGWTEEVDGTTLTEIIRKTMKCGISRFIISDINTSRPDDSPDLTFYAELVEAFPEALFSAAGHIHSFHDVEALKKVGVKEVVVGTHIYKEEAWMDRISEYNKREMEAGKQGGTNPATGD